MRSYFFHVPVTILLKLTIFAVDDDIHTYSSERLAAMYLVTSHARNSIYPTILARPNASLGTYKLPVATVTDATTRPSTEQSDYHQGSVTK